MPGHGSDPDPDRSLDPSRQVHRDSGMQRIENEHGTIREYRPPVGTAHTSERGTRYAWDYGGGAMAGGRGGDVKTLKRASAALSGAANRGMTGQNLYSGQYTGEYRDRSGSLDKRAMSEARDESEARRNR